MTLRIPADHISFTDDNHAWLTSGFIVNGKPCLEISRNTGYTFESLDRPCDTCDGSQRWIDWDRPGQLVECGDCSASGRHMLTIETECDLPMCQNGTPGRWSDGDLCGYCGGGSLFTERRVSVVPGMILPIVDHETWACSRQSEWPHCVVLGTDGHVIEMTMTDPGEGWGVDIDSFPSAAVPGESWAVKMRVAS